MKVNLHTHTARCSHAEGADEEYVKAALSAGFDTLGFSDHVPWPYTSGYTHPRVRMDISRLGEYLESVRALQARYAGELRILAGFECEYFPAYMGWLADMAAENRLDYLILGNHYEESDETGIYFGRLTTPAQLARYVDLTLRGLSTGLFSYLAHPDLFMRAWPGGFDENCRAAARDLFGACLSLGIPVEYNTHQRYEREEGCGYPCREMFEIAREMGVPVLIGLDAHHPEELSNPREWNRSVAELSDLGIARLEMPRLRSFKR